MAEKDVQLGIHVQGLVALKEVRYQILPSSGTDQKLEVKDEVIPSDITLEGFKFLYTRSAKFSPSAFFEICVSFQAEVTFEDEAGKKILKSSESVEEWIGNNIVRIVEAFSLPAKASLLISNLTQGAGLVPLVSGSAFLQ